MTKRTTNSLTLVLFSNIPTAWQAADAGMTTAIMFAPCVTTSTVRVKMKKRSPTRVSRVAWPNGLPRLAEFKLAGAGLGGLGFDQAVFGDMNLVSSIQTRSAASSYCIFTPLLSELVEWLGQMACGAGLDSLACPQLHYPVDEPPAMPKHTPAAMREGATSKY
ncbi:hypothetical protein DFH07DRAFT_772658 [Mycena maculata]|uniref:Uncharacterized protein n=1 Tax=Mycena maculata TaxID=230809 RepID=A0AAD7J6H9_9AGAR|nr:hypothetical protein DFH07DRAFT_772658 [Mycena maculata]